MKGSLNANKRTSCENVAGDAGEGSMMMNLMSRDVSWERSTAIQEELLVVVVVLLLLLLLRAKAAPTRMTRGRAPTTSDQA